MKNNGECIISLYQFDNLFEKVFREEQVKAANEKI